MGMGRKRWRQESLWVATQELPRTKGHVFYDRVKRMLEQQGFDRFAESACEKFYAVRGRPSVAPGVYFRVLLIGYFEGLSSERGIAWRCGDSLSLRHFLGVGLEGDVAFRPARPRAFPYRHDAREPSEAPGELCAFLHADDGAHT